MKKTYIAPAMRVKEVGIHGLICTSTGGVRTNGTYGITYGGIDDDEELELDPE